MRFFRNLFLSAVLIVLAAGCATAKHGRFDRADVTQPEFFPILPWDPYHGWGQPAVADRTNGFKNIAQCYFNMAGFVLPQDLPQCRKLGLGAIMLSTDPAFTNVQYIYQWKNLTGAQIDARVKRMVEASGSDPSIVGYFINDEPGVSEFPALGRAVAAVKKYAPGKWAYINLFPNYATLGAPDTSQLGTPSYSEYLERFVSEVKPQLISYDNYMVQYSMDLRDRAAAANYYRNLLDVRRVALEHHLPYLNIVASCQLLASKAKPSPENLAFQAFTTLAAGYRGVTWYTYFGDFYPNAPLDKAGKKTPTWAALQAVNRQVADLTPILSKLTSTGVYFTAPGPADGLPLLPGKVIESARSSQPLMIGEFQNAAGEPYAMMVNLSLTSPASFTLKTPSGQAPIGTISPEGSVAPSRQDGEYVLPPGQGVLLQFGPTIVK